MDENIFDTASEILQKNGLKETVSDAADKIIAGSDSWIGIILRLTKSFGSGKVSEKDFKLELQQKLNLSLQSAENIVADIKEKILPFIKSNKIENIEPANQVLKSKDTPIIKEVVKERGPIKNLQKEPVLNTVKKNDTYREPIE